MQNRDELARDGWLARIPVVGLAVLAFLVVVSFCIGPRVVHAAYGENASLLIQRILPGSATHPPERYIHWLDQQTVLWTGSALAGLLLLSSVCCSFSARAIVGCVATLGLVLRLVVASRDPETLVWWPMGDDAFYYFQIGRNVVHNHVLQHDSFNVTTGFQPLFLLLTLPAHWMTLDRSLAITLILILQSLLGTVLVLSLYRLVRDLATPLAGILVAGLWALTPACVGLDLNGQETSTALLLCVLCIDFYRRRLASVARPSIPSLIGLGTFMGLAFLARIDTALLSLFILGDLLLNSKQSQKWRNAIRNATVIGCSAAVLALPWIILNIRLGGSPLPSSGMAIRLLSQLFGFPLTGVTHSPAYFDPDQTPVDYYAAMAVCTVRVLRRLAGGTFPLIIGVPLCLVAAVGLRSSVERRTIGYLWGAATGLVLAYVFYVFGPWMLDRYLAPVLLVYLLSCGVGFAMVQRALSAWSMSAPGRMSVLCVTLALLSAGYCTAGFGYILQSARRTEVSHVHMAAAWIKQNTPTNAVIGCYQSGILGYYMDRRFVALDGKVNYEALDALSRKEIDVYIETNHISYLADDRFVFSPLLRRRSRDRTYLERQKVVYDRPNERSGGFVIYEIKARSCPVEGARTAE